MSNSKNKTKNTYNAAETTITKNENTMPKTIEEV